PKPLPHAQAEADFVSRRFAGEAISPALSDRLVDSIKNDCRSLLHWVCHGAEATGSQAVYDEDDEQFSSRQLEGADLENSCTKRKPFVFLNACEVGRTTPALIGVGGFASVFIGLGASCVIAPLWSVKDDIAHEVAQEFYERITADPYKPFADVLRSIRAKANH